MHCLVPYSRRQHSKSDEANRVIGVCLFRYFSRDCDCHQRTPSLPTTFRVVLRMCVRMCVFLCV